MSTCFIYLLYIYGAYVGIMVVTGLDMVGVFVVPACRPFTRDWLDDDPPLLSLGR